MEDLPPPSCLSPPSGGRFMERSSFRRSSFEYSEGAEVVLIQVLAEEVTIQVVADRVPIATETNPDLSEKRVRKAVSKIAGSIIAIVSAVVGLIGTDPPINMQGFPLFMAKHYHLVKLALQGCFLAVMACFFFSLGLYMLSEVTHRPPISISMARKLMLLVLTLVQLAVAMKTLSLIILV